MEVNFNIKKFDALLKSAKKTRKEVCEVLNMDPSTLYRIINLGGGNFKILDLLKIAELLEVDINTLLELYEEGVISNAS